jgi:hypothetical protein
MRKLISVTLLTITAVTSALIFSETAQAGKRDRRERQETYCYPVNQKRVSRDSAYHPRAYTDGYRQGRASARKGDVYKPRTAGGEFARGFEDGYFGEEFSGQTHIVPNSVDYETVTHCSTRTIRYSD